MNKEFVKKIIKSEILRYQAFKEILPEDVKKKLEGFEKDAVNVMKDIAVEIITENSNKKEEAKSKEIKKVSVDFS